MGTGMCTTRGVGLGPVGSGRPGVSALEGPRGGAGVANEVVELRPGPQRSVGGPGNGLTVADQGAGLGSSQQTGFDVSRWPPERPAVRSQDDVAVSHVLNFYDVRQGREVGGQIG